MTSIPSDDYNGRLDYSLTECAGTSVEGERVRAAARPSPDHQPDGVVDLGDGWRAVAFVQAGNVRLSLIPRFGVANHLTLTPAAAHHLAATVAALADTAEQPEEL